MKDRSGIFEGNWEGDGVFVYKMVFRGSGVWGFFIV